MYRLAEIVNVHYLISVEFSEMNTNRYKLGIAVIYLPNQDSSSNVMVKSSDTSFNWDIISPDIPTPTPDDIIPVFATMATKS